MFANANMKIRLLLVVADDDARMHYQEAINRMGVEYDTVSSLTELFRELIRTPYNGILLDVPTKVKATKDESILVHDLLEAFPVIRLRWDRNEGKIRTLFYGQPKENNTIDHFVNHTCRCFQARSARSNRRVTLYANVILSKTAIFSPEDIVRTITIDVSKEGCFIYSSDAFEHCQKVWFIIKELKDETPLSAEVRWIVEWGKTMRPPGIGVKFLDINTSQAEMISSWC
ncbi:MAG: PilZ domain-containing protein [bacterium]